MKLLIIFAAFLTFAVKSESCGNWNQTSNQWPWTVSIFSNSSNMVLCQGSIISNKHILTAGHCLQHKDPSTVLVYPGFVSHRRSDNHQLVWQVEQINLHPDMKLTSRGRFINGGFVASMAIHADLAIVTLKHEIQFNDIITSVCLPIDDSIENIEIHGSYSGWNMNVKNVESLNATIEAIGDAEIFEVAVDEKRVDFVTGTGFYSRMNSSWMIVGLMTMRESEDGSEMNKFISIHKYVNWITNITQSATLPSTNSSFIANVEKSTTSTQASKMSANPLLNSTLSAQSSSTLSSVNSKNRTATPNLDTTNDKQSTTASESILTSTKETPSTVKNDIESQTQNSSDSQSITQKMETTTQSDAKSIDTSSSVASSSSKSSDTATTTENSIPSSNSLNSALDVTSMTPQKLISTVDTKVENSTPLISTRTNMQTTETTTSNEKATKSQSTSDKAKESSENDSTGSSINIDSVTEIPKHIASNLQAVYNRSLVSRLPESRDLKDFGNNVSQGLSTISNRLPSIMLTTLASSPVEEDIITKAALPSLNTGFNVTTEASLSIMNSTDSNDNSTTTISSKYVLLGGLGISPAILITGVCVASLLVLFVIFGLLSLSKPIAQPH